LRTLSRNRSEHRDAERLLVLAPMRVEARAVRAGAPWSAVEKIGIGRRRARAAAPLAQRPDGRAALIAGVCGGLDAMLEPGDVVLASELRTDTRTIVCPGPRDPRRRPAPRRDACPHRPDRLRHRPRLRLAAA
jgi:hypothetical protein